MAHRRVRPFNTGVYYGGGTVANKMSMAVSAGGHVFVRAQTGFDLQGKFVGLGDAEAQAEQAMQNLRVLLQEAGAAVAHIRKVTTYVTDRAWLEPVYAVLDRHLGGAGVRAGLIVGGLAAPEMLVAIDVDAVIPGA